MTRSFLAAASLGILAFVASVSAFATGIFQSITGDVRASVGAAAPARAARDQQVQTGSTVTTGPGSQAIIRLDDGHAIVLSENSEFRINEYRFEKDNPQGDNIALQLLKGAVRSVSGLLTTRNRTRFAFLAPQATIGIRGTDFMVALENPAYLSVLEGAISATNAAGTAVFAAGATGTIATATALAVAIPAAALPATVAATFSQLASVAIAAAAGAGAATGAAAGGLTAPVVAGVAAAAAAAAAIASSPQPIPASASGSGT